MSETKASFFRGTTLLGIKIPLCGIETEYIPKSMPSRCNGEKPVHTYLPEN